MGLAARNSSGGKTFDGTREREREDTEKRYEKGKAPKAPAYHLKV